MTSQLITTMTETWAGAARPAHRGGPHDDALPGPSDFVDQFFDFWVQLLEAQRGVVLSGINALLPSEPAPVQVAQTTPPRARSLTDETSSASGASTTPSSSTAARTIDSTADEHIGGAAADAIATAAAITAEKTATVEKTPAVKKTSATTTSSATTPRKTSTSGKTSTAKKTSAPEKSSTSAKSSPGTTSTTKKASTAKRKRS